MVKTKKDHTKKDSSDSSSVTAKRSKHDLFKEKKSKDTGKQVALTRKTRSYKEQNHELKTVADLCTY